MSAPPLPPDEVARLQELASLEVLDTAGELAFDRITQLASLTFDVPIALVSLVDRNRQWFKSRVGLEVTQTSRDLSFCGHAIFEDSVLEVPDALLDPRFFDNPLVLGEPRIRFYAGAPLISPRGFRLGTLCLIDRKPRRLDDVQRQMLQAMSQVVAHELETRRARVAAERDAKRVRELVGGLPVPLVVVRQDGGIAYANAAIAELTGRVPLAWRGKGYDELFTDAVPPGDASVPQVRTLRHADGREVSVRATPTPLNWEGSQATVVVLQEL